MKTALELQLETLAQQCFNSYDWDFHPLFPNVLIRVFDFEDTTINSRIIKPQTAQAPNHKAVVIRTWEPKLFENGLQESALKPGDIVQIPYYAGVPTFVEKLDEAGYRIVAENVMRDPKTGKVLAQGATQEKNCIYYTCGAVDKVASVQVIINHLINAMDSNNAKGDWDNDKEIAQILDQYEIVPKRVSGA